MSTIYHYTTLKKFQEMWHQGPNQDSDIKDEESNDVDFSYNLVFYASDVRRMNFRIENALVCQALQEGEQDQISSLPISDKVYAISFSKKKDYIPLWDMCVHNDSDIGICLGFTTEAFEERIKKINNNAFTELKLNSCKYLTELGLRRKVKTEINELKRVASLAHSPSSNDIHMKLQEAMIQTALYRLNDFAYEKEVRLIGFVDGERLIKEGQFCITEHRQIKMPLTLLKEIIIGPRTRNEDVVQIGIEGLLESHYLYSEAMKRYGIEIKVEQSKLELR